MDVMDVRWTLFGRFVTAFIPDPQVILHNDLCRVKDTMSSQLSSNVTWMLWTLDGRFT